MIDSTRKRKKSNTSLWIMLVAIVAILVALFLLPSCGGSSSAAATTRVEVGAPAPDFTVEMLDGTRVTLADLRGKVVLLTFWTTWCPHCRTEMERIANEVVPCFADRNFVLLPVSRGESREAVAAFCAERGYDFPVALDPEESVFGRYASEYVPRCFVVAADGRVAASTVGYVPAEFDRLVQTIEDECNELNK